MKATGLKIYPLSHTVKRALKRHHLEKKFNKQSSLLRQNRFHPSLHLELLEPKRMKIYSIRLDKKYRVLLFFRRQNLVEFLNVTTHYR